MEDNGHPLGLSVEELAESISTLEEMATEVGAIATVVHSPPGTEGRRCAVVNVRRAAASTASTLPEVRVAVAGGVDGGKSTLISVLTHGSDGKPDLDNGRGSARMAVLRHKHEIESGRTSCVTHRIIGYGRQSSSSLSERKKEEDSSIDSWDPCSTVLNYSRIAQYTPRELTASANKLVRLSDLGGHQRYSKTSLHGLTSTAPDYAMLCVCAAQGMSWVTRDHLAVALALGVPAFIVITRVDAVEESRVQQSIDEVAAIAIAIAIAAQGPDGIALIETIDDAIRIASKLSIARNEGRTQPMLPVLCTSCVTGSGLAQLHAFLEALTRHESPVLSSSNRSLVQDLSSNGVHFQIDAVMQVAGVGPVLSGVVRSGCLTDGQSLILGPDDDGDFHRVRITGLHRAQVEVECVVAGQHATVAIAAVSDNLDKDNSSSEDGENSTQPTVKEYDHGNHNNNNLAAAFKQSDGVVSRSWSPAGGSSGSDLRGRGLSRIHPDQSPSSDDSPRSPSVSSLHHAQQQHDEDEDEVSGGSFDLRLGDVDTDADACCLPYGRRYKRHTSRKDLDILGKSWEFVRHLSSPGAHSPLLKNGTRHPCAAAAEPAVLHPRIRKGSVLLHSSMQPQACDTFQALIAVLGGHWPEEIVGVVQEDCTNDCTLLPAFPSSTLSLASSSSFEAQASGCCSGNESSSDPKLVVIDTGSDRDRQSIEGSLRRSLSQRSQRSQRPCAFQFMCHCGGVRQAAQIVEHHSVGYEEVHESLKEEWGRVLAGAEAARGVLLKRVATGAGAHPAASILPTAKVVFRFLHRPEWVLPGSRMIFRDRGSGKVAGIGVVE